MVQVFPYPEGASAGNPLSVMQRHLNEIVHRVRAVQDDLVIVGHSSGCAIANAVASQCLTVSPSPNFRLVCLDGFVPSDVLLARASTRVWSARGPQGQKSLNYNTCKQRGGDKFREFKTTVSERWPLHFSLVNKAIDNDHDQITDGYRHCLANLEVLQLDRPIQDLPLHSA
jgi:hypothetical protein